MTPAVTLLGQAGVAFSLHRYAHDPTVQSYGREAAEALGLPPERVFKTLIAKVIHPAASLVAVVVPVARQVDLKALAVVAGGKRAAMADPREAERATGYLVGGISPLGQKCRLSLLLDETALALHTIFVSAGRRGLEIELAPLDLLALTGGRTARITR